MKNDGNWWRVPDFHCKGRARLVCPQITESDDGGKHLPSTVATSTEVMPENDSGIGHSKPHCKRAMPCFARSGRGKLATVMPASTPFTRICSFGGYDHPASQAQPR